MRFEAGLDAVTFISEQLKLFGGFYKGAGDGSRPTAVLLHGLPGTEKNLDIAYRLRDIGWNCLYFHYRGSWGSEGAFSLAALAEDTRAAVQWIVEQPSVDQDRIALISISVGSHPALVVGASDQRICAIASISPLIEPHAFRFSEALAEEIANMLNGVSGQELQEQWDELPSLTGSLMAFSPRPMLLIAAESDEIFPPVQYRDSVTAFRNIELIIKGESDHVFSTSRPWLVQTVTNWLVDNFGN